MENSAQPRDALTTCKLDVLKTAIRYMFPGLSAGYAGVTACGIRDSLRNCSDVKKEKNSERNDESQEQSDKHFSEMPYPAGTLSFAVSGTIICRANA